MKNTFNKIITAGLTSVALFGFALSASAVGTWTAPVGTPPANNTDAPINVGNTTQRKIGALEIGNPSSTTPNGLAVYGQSALIKKVTIGVVPCSGIGCYSGSFDSSSTSTYSGTSGTGGGTGTGTGGGTSGTSGTMTGGSSTTGGWIVPHFASNTGTGFFASLRNAFADTFKPSPAYAVGTTAECAHSYDYPGSPCTIYSSTGVVLGSGTCQWNDTGSLYCSSGTTTGTGTGAGGTTSTSATLATPPTMSFTPSASTITSGSSGSIVWSVSNASTCAVGSANPSNNWTPSSISVSSSTHAASGTKSLGTFTNPGSYSYYLTCTSPTGLSATAAATITVGTTYILETYGNANVNGYMNVTANVYSSGFKQNGIDVCLKNGTNCPTVSTGYSTVFPINTNPDSSGTQGAWIGWNALTGGTGETDFINNKGLGGGGFAFMNQAPGSSTRSTLMMITGSGAVGIGTTSPGADLEVSGTSNRNTPLLKVTSSGTANGDNAATTERGLTVAASSAAGQGKLLNVKRGSTDLFNVAGNGNTYIQHSVIGPSAGGDGVPLYVATNNCYGFSATSTATGSGLWGPAGPGSTYVSTGYMIPPYTIVRYPYCLVGFGGGLVHQPNTFIGYLSAN